MISIRSIQDYIHEDDCRWVPTQFMWADVLTKEDKALCQEFQQWMAHPYVTLVDEKKIHQCEITTDRRVVLLSIRDALHQPVNDMYNISAQAGPLS